MKELQSLLSLKQVADRLGQSISTVRRRIRLKEIRAIQPRKHCGWRVDPMDLKKWEKENASR